MFWMLLSILPLVSVVPVAPAAPIPDRVEIWFGIITQRAIRRGTFRHVSELVAKIKDFVQHYNRRCHPFVWTATADSILAKIERLCKAVAGTAH